jgi:dipeptidase D
MDSNAIRNFRCTVPIYEKQNGDKPRVVASGLECGILGTNYPDMDLFWTNYPWSALSDEEQSISSSQKFWKFLIEILVA